MNESSWSVSGWTSLADLTAWRDGHDDDLLMLSGQDLAPERIVGPSGRDDVHAIGFE